MKSQADKMGFPTFSDYLKKDDENIKKEIAVKINYILYQINFAFNF